VVPPVAERVILEPKQIVGLVGFVFTVKISTPVKGSIV
jgi:hypothetical protein